MEKVTGIIYYIIPITLSYTFAITITSNCNFGYIHI